jgi:hypothetical protein
MVPFNILVLVCLVYVGLLFLVAFLVERRAQARALPWLRSPLIYTLSLSIFCTAWTFYGAVGYAARSGLEFLTIYLGPTLIFVGWWWVLRKLVRIGRQREASAAIDQGLGLLRIEAERIGIDEQFDSLGDVRALRTLRESLVPQLPPAERGELQARLEAAVRTENYELAAILRDELRRL